MKLRNKKTGEIPDKIETIAYIQWSKMIMMVYINNDGERIVKQYDSLETFNEEWEDYEEPKVYYYISDFGAIRECEIGKFPEDEEDRKAIGNYFETKEEAEKAVEKLKAWKRLKDKGFRFNGVEMFGSGFIRIEASIPINEKTTLQERSDITDSLYLLFGGEE